MSYYVKRTKTTESTREQRGHRPSLVTTTASGWTGPIRSATQAAKEARAWFDAGWDATVELSTPEIRAEVRAWEKTRKAVAR